ncbi:MAG TPA: dihydrolipoamide acetyltransferase family protein [Bacillales bacterium]|nr:dihydrolipoamide acetyltransferase family protein [Bacillales bacterium]
MPYHFKLPDIGEGLHEAEIVNWLVKEGDRVEADQPVAEVQTDKATVEISSPVSGIIASLAEEKGGTVEVGETLVVLDQDGAQPAPDSGEPDHGPPAKSAPQKNKKRVIAAPTVRKKARELGIEITEVTGSEKNGRIIEADLERFLQEQKDTANLSISAGGKLSDYENEKQTEERIPVRGLRKKIAEKMVQSKYTAPHVTGMRQIDVTRLVKARKRIREKLQPDDPKLTYLPFIIKAVVRGLKKVPIFNASYDLDTQEIILKKRYNIGIAVATDAGLVVPVIKNADQKTIFEIAGEIEELTEKARNQKLSLQDIQDGTFTISSTGSDGGWFATPIINYPEVAILGVHTIQKMPVVDDDDQIVVRNMMGTSLTFDHRVIDGEPSGRFMKIVSDVLENPEMLWLEVR